MLTSEETIQTWEIELEIHVEAPIAVVFQSVLDELGPERQMPDGTPFPMRIEPRPGGRWYRDLGNDSGHFWGHVQVIKPPTLLEIWGPLFMSYPAINFVQYRLAAEGGGTRLKLVHRALGPITAEHREGVREGWEYGLKRIRQLAMQRKAARRTGP